MKKHSLVSIQKKIFALKIVSIFLFLLLACHQNGNAPGAVSVDPMTLTVDLSTVISLKAKKLLGLSFDGRSSLNLTNGSPISIGYHDTLNGTMLAGIQPLWARLPVTGFRYPGNAVTFNWNWKYTIGTQGSRTSQLLAPGVSQALTFGFDEFMDMVEARGLPTTEVQIMVNIYPIAGEVSAAQSAADWVEYCNAPNNASNIGGGTDWAAVRAANGHPLPYDVKVWNIGNEPWGPTEYNFDATPYIPMAVPIIDAMRAIDPTIQITIPAVGNSTSAWNTAIMGSSSLAGKFWGLSPHFFYDENSATSNPSVAQAEVLLKSLETLTKANGLKLVIGDHANDAPVADTDEGFRWKGALATADFLVMASQVTNIEQANYWIYGNPKALWHPIRKNTDGTYTFMAAAQVYEEFSSAFLDKSVATTLLSATGAAPTNARASAYISADNTKVNIIAVNIDTAIDQKITLPIVSGYSLASAALLSGALTDDTIVNTNVTLSSGGYYDLPRNSVLILKYQ